MSDERPFPDYAPPPGPHQNVSLAGCAAGVFGAIFGVAGVLVLVYTLFLFVFTDMRREHRMELAVVFLIGATLLGASVHWLAEGVHAFNGRNGGENREGQEAFK